MRIQGKKLACCLLTLHFIGSSLPAGELPSRDDVLAAMRRAGGFFAANASIHGGYHESYSNDLQWARSPKNARGRQQFSVVPGATPAVGLAFLEAWEVTQDRFYLDAAQATCHALIYGQLCSGGWDYKVDVDPQKRKKSAYHADGTCPSDSSDRRRNHTNLDNNSTPGALRLLMRTDRALDFKDTKLHAATRYALERIVAAQYPNGAWAQRFEGVPDPAKFPVKPASYPESWPREWPGNIYYSYYTFNDDCIVHMIDVLLEASGIYNEPGYRASAEKAGDFIILAQMPEPQPAWAQQYNADMHPAWARVFEPPAVSGRESMDTMKGLLLLYRETGKKKYLEPIPRAVAYLRRSTYQAKGRSVVARFHELRTNRPLYVTGGDRIESDPLRELRESNLATLDLDVGDRKHFRWWLNGYELTYGDSGGVGHYGLVSSTGPLDEVAAEYERVVRADPVSLRRPGKLRGLAPVKEFGTRELPTAESLAEKVREAISSLDERGAWVEPGLLDGPGQLLRVLPANDMVIYLNGQVFPLTSKDDFRVYQGAELPEAGRIGAGTFTRRMALFADYLRAL